MSYHGNREKNLLVTTMLKQYRNHFHPVPAHSSPLQQLVLSSDCSIICFIRQMNYGPRIHIADRFCEHNSSPSLQSFSAHNSISCSVH